MLDPPSTFLERIRFAVSDPVVASIDTSHVRYLLDAYEGAVAAAEHLALFLDAPGGPWRGRDVPRWVDRDPANQEAVLRNVIRDVCTLR
jgi:hypothetical protein